MDRSQLDEIRAFEASVRSLPMKNGPPDLGVRAAALRGRGDNFDEIGVHWPGLRWHEKERVDLLLLHVFRFFLPSHVFRAPRQKRRARLRSAAAELSEIYDVMCWKAMTSLISEVNVNSHSQGGLSALLEIHRHLSKRVLPRAL